MSKPRSILFAAAIVAVATVAGAQSSNLAPCNQLASASHDHVSCSPSVITPEKTAFIAYAENGVIHVRYAMGSPTKPAVLKPTQGINPSILLLEVRRSPNGPGRRMWSGCAHFTDYGYSHIDIYDYQGGSRIGLKIIRPTDDPRSWEAISWVENGWVNTFSVVPGKRWTSLRLNIYPPALSLYLKARFSPGFFFSNVATAWHQFPDQGFMDVTIEDPLNRVSRMIDLIR